VTGPLWAVIAFIAGLGAAALGDMVSEEVRDRLDHLPHALLHLAARRLDPTQRITVYEDEWLPELAYILKGDQARPVTRLIHGTSYALGILTATPRITRHLHRPAPPALQQPQPAPAIAQPATSNWTPGRPWDPGLPTCPNCGVQVQPEDLICFRCGQNLPYVRYPDDETEPMVSDSRYLSDVRVIRNHSDGIERRYGDDDL
jgi:hypothetical protein